MNVDTNKSIPKQFICVLTGEIMSEPVIAFDGNTYEKSAIVKYLTEHKCSPVTKASCEDSSDIYVYPNRSLKRDINNFLSERN